MSDTNIGDLIHSAAGMMVQKDKRIRDLEAENERLRETLQQIVDHGEPSAYDTIPPNSRYLYRIAVAALEEK